MKGKGTGVGDELTRSAGSAGQASLHLGGRPGGGGFALNAQGGWAVEFSETSVGAT